MLRSIMLKLAANQALLKAISQIGMRYGLARRFIAGEQIEDALRAVGELRSRGILACLDLLGEGVRDERDAQCAAAAYVGLLEHIHRSHIDSYVSIKLTQLGLEIDRGLCASHLRSIIQKACDLGNLVRIDMESSAHTQDTLDLFFEQYAQHPRQVGIVIQSYLYRSEADVRRLCALGCNVRLCKGAYMERPEVAFPRKRDVDRNYVRLLKMLLGSSAYTAIATHDSRIIDEARRFIADQAIAPDRYEFQMLYGVRREYQVEIREAGYRMRVYVPYGRQWAPYFMRRLAERPANVFFILKNLLRK